MKMSFLKNFSKSEDDLKLEPKQVVGMMLGEGLDPCRAEAKAILLILLLSIRILKLLTLSPMVFSGFEEKC